MKKIILLALLFLIPSLSLFAENFTIEQYDVEIEVGENRVYTINEKLVLDYTTPSHGFFRDIPYRYSNERVIKAEIDNITSSDPYQKEKNGDYLRLKVGDGDKYVEGVKEYNLSYTYDLGEDLYPDYDEFYYNIIGDGWNTTIRNISFKITFPSPIEAERIWLTSAEYGSLGFTGEAYFDGDRTVFGFVPALGPHEAVTLRVEMDEGYFVGAREIKDYSRLAGIVTISLGILIIIYFIIAYYKYGVDDPLNIVVNYDAPEGLTPLECGFLVDESADDRDIGAMLFYWADKGYLTIEEENAKSASFIFHKKKELDENATASERKLFNALFKAGNDVDTEDLENTHFAKAVMENVKPSISSYFTGERALFEKKSKNKATLITILSGFYLLLYSICMSIANTGALFLLIFSMVFFIISLCFSSLMRKYRYIKKNSRLAFFLLYLIIAFVGASFNLILALSGNTSAITTIISFVLFIVITLLGTFGANAMEKRSAYCQHALENVLGYREFIDKVEIDKLKMLIDQDREYFYHVLSYAICFGLEDKWAKKFETLFVQPASWYYSPYNTAVDYVFYSSLYRRWSNTYKSQIVPASYPNSTSGHGGASTFSGSSGFSGGGFGGGGGGSW